MKTKLPGAEWDRVAEWWKTVFDERYLKTYVDLITPDRTGKEVSLMLERLQLQKGARILDLACGYGRHAIELAKRGCRVTGVDFSKHFIELAKKEAKKQNVHVSFIRDDMRRIAFRNRFDAVINIFTSFGYFEDENDHALVLRNISRALKPEGKFLMDLSNALGWLLILNNKGSIDNKSGFLTMLTKERLSNGLSVKTKHEFNPETMRSLMTRTWKEKGRNKSYTTNLRVFFLPELKKMMQENGLTVKNVWGNLDGSPFRMDSPRLVVLAKKS